MSSSGKRIACVSLPEFPLQLLMQRHVDWNAYPAVVVDRDKAQGVVLWANERARRLRILPGMRYAAALAISSDVRAGVVTDTEIAEAVAAVTERLRFFSAEIEPSEHEPGVFWLDASGLSLLYPSLLKWAHLIRNDLTGDYRATIAVGFSRFGTYAVSKTSRGAIVFKSTDDEHDRTERVPIELLGFDPRLRDTLAKLGINTVGGFLDLPANGVKKRFGADAHRLHQLARGDLFAPLEPQPPQDPIFVNLHLDYAEADIDRLMALVEKQLGALFIRLNERCELLAAINIGLTFDDRGQATERLQPASPTLNSRQIADLIRLRLSANKSLSAGVVDVTLEAEGTPAERKQAELFVEKSPRDLEAAGRSFARLRAEFGEDAVVRARLRDGHLPEATYEWEPMDSLEHAKPRNVRFPPLVRRIYKRPVVFSPGRQREADTQLTAHIDDGTIRETQGPYMVSGGWWTREVQREYYFVNTATGRSLWMFYDRRRMSWYVHGEVE